MTPDTEPITQDIRERETFAPSFWTKLRTGPGRVWIPLTAAVVVLAIVAVVVALLAPERQHFLFDIVLALVMVALTFRALSTSVRAAVGKPHAEMRSLALGTAAAGAIFAVLLYTLHGQGVGWWKTPAFVLASLAVMIVGACVAGLIGIVCYWPVHVAAGIAKIDLRAQAVLIGALTGLAATFPLALAQQVTLTLSCAAVLLGVICTYRAATLYERCRRKPSTEGRR